MQERSQSLARWLERQQSVHPKSIDLGLARVTEVARRLGVAQLKCPVVTVGGTNGKGSVVAHIDAILRAAGITTGVFTSPHILRYNERIKLDGREVSDDALVAAFEQIESARADITLTYFEYSTLAALSIFAERMPRVAVLEVGLGGRLDASNLVDPTVAVVASIGMDHRDWLGDTLNEIAAEKAGIFRPGRPAVLGSQQMPPSLFAIIDSLSARPLVAERDFKWHVRDGDWSYSGVQLSVDGLPASALPGAIQYRNAATAIAAIEALSDETDLPRPEREAIAAGLRAVELPGRFQIIPGPIEWILDVAHNEPAAHVLAAHLHDRPCNGRTLAVISVLGDKDIEAIGRALLPVIDDWILCAVDEPRGLTASGLRARLSLPERCSITLANSVASGCEHARSVSRSGDRVVVCGSFLVVAAALRWLRLY